MSKKSKMQRELEIQSEIINERFERKFPYIIKNAETVVEVLNDLSPDKKNKYYNKMARLFYIEFMQELGTFKFDEVRNTISNISPDHKKFMDQVCIDII